MKLIASFAERNHLRQKTKFRSPQVSLSWDSFAPSQRPPHPPREFALRGSLTHGGAPAPPVPPSLRVQKFSHTGKFLHSVEPKGELPLPFGNPFSYRSSLRSSRGEPKGLDPLETRWGGELPFSPLNPPLSAQGVVRGSAPSPLAVRSLGT